MVQSREQRGRIQTNQTVRSTAGRVGGRQTAFYRVWFGPMKVCSLSRGLLTGEFGAGCFIVFFVGQVGGGGDWVGGRAQRHGGWRYQEVGQIWQMPRGGFFFVGCTQRDSAEGATAPIGAAVYEKNTTRALCPPQKYICSLRSGKKNIWTVVERDAISQNILLFRGPMGPLDLAHGASSNAAPRPREPFYFDRRICA